MPYMYLIMYLDQLKSHAANAFLFISTYILCFSYCQCYIMRYVHIYNC